MSRLAPLDKALVLILVPLWVASFANCVWIQVRGGGTAIVALSLESADSYPALTVYFSPLAYASDPFAQAGLRAGDRLVRVGDADLRGVGTFGFAARAFEESAGNLSVPLVFERNSTAGTRRAGRATSFTPRTSALASGG